MRSSGCESSRVAIVKISKGFIRNVRGVKMGELRLGGDLGI